MENFKLLKTLSPNCFIVENESVVIGLVQLKLLGHGGCDWAFSLFSSDTEKGIFDVSHFYNDTAALYYPTPEEAAQALYDFWKKQG